MAEIRISAKNAEFETVFALVTLLNDRGRLYKTELKGKFWKRKAEKIIRRDLLYISCIENIMITTKYDEIKLLHSTIEQVKITLLKTLDELK